MLFRKGDLAALREKAKTPFGQAYLAAARESGDLISLGMLYQLTGDKALAAEAMEAIRAFKGQIDPNPAGSGSTGHRLVEVAFAYDLCSDAWPDNFRHDLADGILAVIQDRQRRLHPGHANYHPCSNYYGPSHGSAALAGLAIWGEKGPAPPEPEAPFTVAEPSAAIAPAAGYKPGRGVPVSKFASNEMAPEWIYAGGFRPAAGEDALAALGGAAKARPEAGTTLACGGRTDAFRPLSHEPDKGFYEGSIDATNATGRINNSVHCFYTVIENARPRWVQAATDNDSAEVYVSGVRVWHGDVGRLEAGLYPVMAVVPEGETPPWGRVLLRPRLAELAEDEARSALADRRAAYDLDRAVWQAGRQAWGKSGGGDPVKTFFADMARHRVYLHYRLGVGDGGFQAETGSYALIGTWYPLVYAAAHRTMFGCDVSPHPDITHLVPRRMMQVVFREDGTQLVQKINSVVGFDVRWCAAGYPIAPQAYQPALLWAWNWATGVTGPASAAKAVPAVGDRKATGTGLNLAHTFINYPLGASPVPPARAMPLEWEAPDFGFYCFRSGWEGRDEFVGQVFLKAKPVNGWNHGNGGTFGLLGLGQVWVAGSEGRNGVRPQEPVVWLPEDGLNDSGCARLRYLKTERDGSASMTFDLGEIYSAAEEGRRMYDRNLIRLAEPSGASGVTGLRAIAFDYSGESGAPCLMALVDQIHGGKRKEWLWQLPLGSGKKGEAKPAVRVEGSTFTIEQGGAALRATFLAPRPVALDYATENVQVGDPRHGFHGPIHRVKAAGGGEFFVVVTVQRGPAPDVRADGAGLGTVATVGRRTVRFDGQKILFGP
jgi:hypothetical protein